MSGYSKPSPQTPSGRHRLGGRPDETRLRRHPALSPWDPAPVAAGIGGGLGFGRYVGRVGALAVALGVGVAVATGQGVGVARADDAPSSTSPADAANGATTAGDSTGPSTPEASAGTDASATANPGPKKPTVPTMNVQASGTATTSVDNQADDEAPSGGAGDPREETDSGAEEELEPVTTSEPVAMRDGVVTPTVDGANARPAESLRDTVSLVAELDSTVLRTDSALADATATAAHPARTTAVRLAPISAQPDTPTVSVPTATTSAALVAPTTPTPRTPALQPQDPISALLTLPGALLAAVLSPFVAPGPAAPAGPPLLLAVLGLVAREIERILFNSTPVIRNQTVDLALQDPDDVSGPISFGATDHNGEPLLFSVPARGAVGGPTRGTVTVDQATGTFVYDADDAVASVGGTDSFTVTVTDAAGEPHLHGLLGLLTFGAFGHTSTATITVNIAAVNDAPIARDDAFTTPEDTALTGNVLTNDRDVDSPTLTAALGVRPVNGVVALLDDGTFEYVPAEDFNGTDSFTYIVSDGQLSDVATVTITVAAVNDPITAVTDRVTLIEDSGPVTGNVLDNDRAQNSDGAAEVLAVTGGGVNDPEWGSVVFSTDGGYVYTPAPNFAGTFAVQYRVSDGQFSDSGTLIFTVTPAADPIIGVQDVIVVDEDATTVTGNLLDNDRAQNPDGAAEVLTITDPGTVTVTLGTLTVSADGAYTFTPAANESGTATFEYTVTDGTSTSTTSLVVLVNAVNDAIVAVDDTTTVAEDSGPVAGNLLDNDRAGNPDGPDETLTIVNPGTVTRPLGTLTVAADGTYTFTPAANESGTAVYPVTVTDGTTINTATLTITVTPVNDPVVAIPDTLTLAEDSGPVTGNLLDNDRAQNVDGTGEILTIVTPGTVTRSLGTLTVAADGTYTFTPAANQNGTAVYPVTVTDGTTINTATLTITVTAVNDAPTAPTVTPNPLTADEVTGEITGIARSSDVDGDPLSYSGSLTTAKGVVVVNANGTFTYTPSQTARESAATAASTDTFDITVSDGRLTATTSVTVAISPVNVVIAEVSVGQYPNGVAVSPDGTRVYVTNQNSGTVSVINTADNSVAAPITVGVSPTAIVVNPTGTRAYVTNQSADTVSVINTANNTVIGTITVGDAPVGLAINRSGTRVYVANATSSTPAVTDGTVSVINTADNTVTSISVPGGPRSVALSADESRIYVTLQDTDRVVAISTSTNAVVTTFNDVGDRPNRIVLTPSGRFAYVTNETSSTVAVLDLLSNTVINRITVNSTPNVLAISPDGTRVYVTGNGAQRVTVIDTATNRISGYIDVGEKNRGVAVSPDGTLLYVTSSPGQVAPGAGTTTSPGTVSVVAIGSLGASTRV